MSDERTEEQVVDEIGNLISEVMALRHPDDPPFLKGWAVSALIDSVAMFEQSMERSEYIQPSTQSIILTIGLHTVAARHSLEDDEE